MPLRQKVEEILQTETLDMQAQVALTQLDPVGQHVVVFANLVGELTDIVQFLLVAAILQTTGFVNDSVDEGGDTIDE